MEFPLSRKRERALLTLGPYRLVDADIQRLRCQIDVVLNRLMLKKNLWGTLLSIFYFAHISVVGVENEAEKWIVERV